MAVQFLQIARCMGGAAAVAGSLALAQRTQGTDVSQGHRAPVFCDVARQSSTARLTRKATGGKYEKTALYQTFKRRYGTTARQVQMTQKDISGILSDIGIVNPLLQDRIFFVMDEDGGGTVDFGEMSHFCHNMALGAMKHKTAFLFKACDMEAEGFVEKTEMREFLKQLVLECHKNVPSYSIVSKDSDVELFADIPVESLARIVANRIVIEMWKGHASADKLNLKEFTQFVTRGGKAFDELVELFPVFDAFIKEE